MSIEEEKLDPVKFHEQHAGKIAINSKVDVYSEEDLSVVYTPGVSQVSSCLSQMMKRRQTRLHLAVIMIRFSGITIAKLLLEAGLQT